MRLTAFLAARRDIVLAEQAATYKGTGLPRSPRTDPYRQLSRIRLLPWVSDGEAFAWPGMKDSGSGEPFGSELLYPLPCRAVPLAAALERAQP